MNYAVIDLSLLESIGTMGFVFLFILAVIGAIFLVITLFSYIIKKLPINTLKAKPLNTAPASTENISTNVIKDFSAGELKLTDTSEETAAMIMAIVSDESEIPLNELCFKSIKLLTKESN